MLPRDLNGVERYRTDHLCPHCWLDHRLRPHSCGDREAWTDAEREEWLRRSKRWYPSLVAHLAPSTREMADRFGERNRLDREKEANDV